VLRSRHLKLGPEVDDVANSGLMRCVNQETMDGIAASPFGWPILYVETTLVADLMLIENFR
jgi:hypothetical protein